MREPLKIKPEDLRQQRFKELLNLCEPVFATFGVDFYLLGAIARDVWYSKDQLTSRSTRDDLAIPLRFI
ncbi:MAG: hypothetical protein LAT75_11895 [Candidatus Cyclonatronum sp.]|uniref:hypothetical protein n=1 Tax=Cyclonatronum sp. TaxID=3024185 RepID=UPI0025BC3D3C|nr:hypothetical protein [Cyclonatronum sp.]MCH8487561.1 hypothetical protein [Cyclonatronum sp.]